MDDPVVQGTLIWVVLFFAMAVFSAIGVVKFKEDFDVVLPALMLGYLSSMCFLGLLAVLCKQLIG